ncbi:MAG: hypothetical protein WC637_14060 [Victivallales bacterium]|jgi:hypothetical protein
MIINIIFLATIIAGITGIFFCLKADKKNPRKKDPKAGPIALVLLLIIIASTIAILVRLANQDVKGEQPVSEELFYSRVSGVMLGRYLARTAPGSNALIITYDRNSENSLLDASMDGIREGLGGKVRIAAIDSPIKPAPLKASEKTKISPEKMLYLSRKVQSNNLDQVIARHPECNLVISLIGLPKDANKMLIFTIKPEKRPKLALLSSNISMMKDRIAQGDINVAIINRPDYIPGKNKIPKDIELAFDKRFLVVTPDSVKAVASDYPSLFTK